MGEQFGQRSNNDTICEGMYPKETFLYIMPILQVEQLRLC